MKRLFITDKEVAELLSISVRTLSSIVGGFVRGGLTTKKTHAKIDIDLLRAEPESFGGFRRWRVTKLANILGITEDELLKRL